MIEIEEELKSLLMKVKDESEAGLKLNIQKPKIMRSDHTTSQQLEEEKLEAWPIIFPWAPLHCRWWLHPGN